MYIFTMVIDYVRCRTVPEVDVIQFVYAWRCQIPGTALVYTMKIATYMCLINPIFVLGVLYFLTCALYKFSSALGWLNILIIIILIIQPCNLHQLLPSTPIHSIIPIPFMWLTIFFVQHSLQVLFGLPLGLELSTSNVMHFFTQSVSSFCNTCPYHLNENFKFRHKFLHCKSSVNYMWCVGTLEKALRKEERAQHTSDLQSSSDSSQKRKA